MVEWLLTALPNSLGLVGLWIVGRKKRWGFLVGFSSEVAWTILAFYAHLYGLFPWIVAWSLVYLVGYSRWGQTE